MSIDTGLSVLNPQPDPLAALPACLAEQKQETAREQLDLQDPALINLFWRIK